jgi:hypothetical protein
VAWIPKAGAPSSFSLSQAFAALISGDLTWSWLASFVPLIPPTQYDTEFFCSAGPAPAPQLTQADFVNALAGGPQNVPPAVAQYLGAKLAEIAYDRMFQAYCVNDTGGWGAPICNTVSDPSFNTGNPEHVDVPLPEGTTQVRVTWTNVLGSGYVWTQDATHTLNWSGINHDTDPGPAVQTFAPTGGSAFVHVASAGTHATICLEFLAPAGSGYTATDQPRPDGITLPATNVYDTIGDLGAELDRQELKLDYLLAILSSHVNETPVPVGEPLEDVPVEDDQVLDVAHAAGAVFVLTQMPPSADVVFSTPPVIHRLGRIFWGTPTGWHEPQDFVTTPLVILPKPQGSTRLKVQMVHGALASVRLIPAAIPL